MDDADIPEPIQIVHNLVMLCEGTADNEFFRKLISYHKLPQFDFPFPPPPMPDGSRRYPNRNLYGNSGYKDMLSLLASYLKYKPELKTQIYGILIVADSTNEPLTILNRIKKQIKGVGTFGVPDKVMTTIGSSDNFPSISILLLPISGKGGLETVCLEYLRTSYQAEMGFLEYYFDNCSTKPLTWEEEKRDKARFHALVAATYRPDPSCSLSAAFRNKGGKPPVIDIGAQCFNPIADYVREFCRSVGIT